MHLASDTKLGFFHWNISTIHKDKEFSNYQCQGTKVPGNEGSKERKLSGMKVPWILSNTMHFSHTPPPQHQHKLVVISTQSDFSYVELCITGLPNANVIVTAVQNVLYGCHMNINKWDATFLNKHIYINNIIILIAVTTYQYLQLLYTWISKNTTLYTNYVAK